MQGRIKGQEGEKVGLSRGTWVRHLDGRLRPLELRHTLAVEMGFYLAIV